MTDYLTRTTLLRLLATLLLVVAPHALHLPVWLALLVVTVIGWRALITLRQWHLPGTLVRVALVLVGTGGVYASFHSISGLSAGTAMLCIMASLKLLEMRTRRDVMVMVMMMYFILITHFLFSQELWTILYLLFSTCAITALLVDCNHSGEPLPLRPLARRSGIMIAQALPIMLIFFVLFPRIPGPLWGLPADTGATRSGLSDKMSPGDISKLIQSSGIAFRVHFSGTVPPPAQRYWRGPVMNRFDGRSWEPREEARKQVSEVARLRGPAVSYEITLEPHQQRWLFALDLPDADHLPPNSELHGAYQLMSKNDVRDRMLYVVVSHPDYILAETLNNDQRRINLLIPRSSNPKTRALAQQWRDEGLDDQHIVQKALHMFRNESYYYSLEAPLLGTDSVDDFLFTTRKGFCEHYSSSFTFLMRAAGIPARVVTGYQGGEKNNLGDYYVIHQYDAHAWSEVWLSGKGWVRVDPTAAVSPLRIENGLASSMRAADGLPAFLERRSAFLLSINARWDWVNDRWNRWVLAYGPDLQAQFLRNFGIEDYSDMVLALTIGATVLMSLIGLSLLRQFSPASNPDFALRQWRIATRRLTRSGYAQALHEGPQDFIARVKADHPQFAPALDELLRGYLHLRYLEASDKTAEQRLLAAVRQIKTLKIKPHRTRTSNPPKSVS
jgi:transglutaminase-like putative cysteine protease